MSRELELKPVQHWPFKESPGELARRLADETRGVASFGGMSGPDRFIAVLRGLLIERPPTLSAEYLSLVAPELGHVECAGCGHIGTFVQLMRDKPGVLSCCPERMPVFVPKVKP